MDREFVTDRGGSEKRKKIQYDDLPEELIQAVIATEDSRFFEHPGIDIPRIFGAIKANIVNGFGSEGASTITQRSEEHTSELQSRGHIVCRILLEKKNTIQFFKNSV